MGDRTAHGDAEFEDWISSTFVLLDAIGVSYHLAQVRFCVAALVDILH